MSENPTDVPKAAPSIISNQLRDELIRILHAGDDKHNGAFTIGVAAQVEKFVAAAREILMTEKLAQSDLGSLMRMRKPHLGGAWSGVVGSSLGYDELPSPMISPIVNNENFGVQAIRQLVEVARTMSETPAKLVEALAVARSHNLDDVVAALEKKLGVSKAGSEADAADVPIPTLPDGTPIPTLPDGRPLQ